MSIEIWVPSISENLNKTEGHKASVSSSHLKMAFLKNLQVFRCYDGVLQMKIIPCFFPHCIFFMQFAVKIDQVEDFLKNAQEFDNIDSLRELLLQQEHHAKGTSGIPFLTGCYCVLIP